MSIATSPTRTAGALTDPTGRWQIDATRSTLGVAVRVGVLATVHGRFQDVTGDLVMADDPLASQVTVSIRTASLTSGRSTVDSVLIGAGVVDTRRNPMLGFASCGVRPTAHPDRWLLDGLLATEGGLLDVTLEMATPQVLPDGSLRCHATGALPSRDAVRLLSRPGLERMLGRSMELDLVVVATRS
ncbi:YceI family protein [Nakamurella endophytica]|uniref:Lipid/polyisoprenoid-binding YceI-like domain-containing protein n=1 Tax=Nakamurella endophytica TaxID=1748367 RepID=A0A917SW31_9ACTN|nr:YceI family protein [Nakamurella endophytica]GGM00462.1 hypothetical protein GCM10011594_20650 [Nakamurella endophytica]